MEDCIFELLQLIRKTGKFNILEIVSKNMTEDEMKKYDDVRLNSNEFHIIAFQIKPKDTFNEEDNK